MLACGKRYIMTKMMRCRVNNWLFIDHDEHPLHRQKENHSYKGKVITFIYITSQKKKFKFMRVIINYQGFSKCKDCLSLVFFVIIKSWQFRKKKFYFLFVTNVISHRSALICCRYIGLTHWLTCQNSKVLPEVLETLVNNILLDSFCWRFYFYLFCFSSYFFKFSISFPITTNTYSYGWEPLLSALRHGFKGARKRGLAELNDRRPRGTTEVFFVEFGSLVKNLNSSGHWLTNKTGKGILSVAPVMIWVKGA